MPPRPRLRRRLDRGLSLFGALLALAVFSVLMLGVMQWYQARSLEERDERAAAQLSILATAARSHVIDSFPTLLAGAVTQEITLATLRTANLLSPAFRDRDAMGRAFRILLRRPSTGVLDLVVTQTVAAGDLRWPARAAATHPVDAARLGTVTVETPTRLTGPAVDVDISAFQAAFTGAPTTRAMAAYARIDRETVYGGQLYRAAASGFPEINRMETDLDMAGNAITGASSVEADAITVDTTLDVGGTMTVIGGLVVGQTATITGAVDLTGDLTAATATITGTASAATVTSTGQATAASLTTTGTVTAGTIGSSGAMTVSGSATMADLTATSVSAGTLTSTTVSATDVTVRQMTATGTMTAANAGITTLTVGSCSGC